MPDDAVELMNKTTELSDLIYWKPLIELGSDAENIELTSPTSRERDGAKTGIDVVRQSDGEMTDSDWARD